ncbi:MAG TPA: hybrid sensor histidine kinase/response regulator [Myxococcaceae bacterium]|nr:hybrid sensor histidine kinase/response regulator [Myxococcaceae bacterium]
MKPNAIETALRALDATSTERVDNSTLNELRQPLGEGERTLFDRALELRRGYDALHQRVLRSAVFAEAALGTAAFIHELRQCISPVIGLAELLKESPDSPFVHEWVTEISGQAMRLADLLDRHAALLRNPASPEGPCDVASVVNEASRYFSRLPPGVKLELKLPEGLPMALTRRRQLLHALINLMANARDAHRGRPGTIEVGTRVQDGTLEIVISDQGCGVDPAIRHRLFEPLFTTKDEDGTGLGLFLSRELLRPRGELVLLDGKDLPEGAVTAFAIRLPLADAARTQAPEQAAVVEPKRPSGGADSWTAAKRRAATRAAELWAEEKNHPVLLVEDEPAVRRMTRAVLESVTHIKIYEAADAAFALGLLERLKVDFLVCDKNLPDHDGLEVIRRAKARHPNIDAMIVTGYPSPDSAAEAIRMGATDYLVKPVREVKSLRESVAAALLRQRLHRLCDNHADTWRELCRDLGEHTPEGGASRMAIEAMLEQLAAEKTPRPVTVGIIGEEATAAGLQATGLEVVRLGSTQDLPNAGRDLDLLVFPAEQSPEDVKKLVSVVRGLPCPPHLAALGRFAYTEAAVSAIQGRTGVLLDRAASHHDSKVALLQASTRRRRELRSDTLGKLLRELGITLEPAVNRPQGT